MTGRRADFGPYLAVMGEHIRVVGGEFIPEPCTSREIPVTDSLKPEVSKVTEAAYTCGCGGTTRVRLPYYASEHDEDNGVVSMATVCAICDMGYAFPEYGAQVPPAWAR